MSRREFKSGGVFMLVTLLAIGCSTVNYVGKSFNPTTNIDVYYSKEEIKNEYTIIGHSIGSTPFISNDKIVAKLIEEAKSKGADAVLITGLGKSNIFFFQSPVSENQINASFLKYE